MRNTIFPAYVVIDFSKSMRLPVEHRARIDVAKDILPTILKSMKADASVAESLRVRVIGFNGGVIFCTELYDYYELEKWYNKEKDQFWSKCDSQTWYGSAFGMLNTCINKDIDELTRQGKGYYRPLVYFLTDGKPVGEDANVRDSKYRALVNNSDEHRRPAILCIGIGDEDMSILQKYGASRLGSKNGEYRTQNYKMTFIIRKGVKTGDGLKVLNESVVRTIKDSLQQRLGNKTLEKKIDHYEIDFTEWEDPDVINTIKMFFNRDRLS